MSSLNNNLVPNLDSSKITSGTIDSARLPSISADSISNGSTNLLYQTKTGTQLEDGNYTAGQLYYCSATSDSFQVGTIYLATGTDSIIKFSGTPISTNPAISSFSISPNSTELGNAQSLTYSYSLKKFGTFTALSISDGTTPTSLTPAESVTGASISGTYSTATTFTLSGTANGSNLSKTAYFITKKRYYVTKNSSTSYSTVFSAIKSTLSSTSSTITALGSRITNAQLSLGSSNTYVYFVIPSEESITAVKSAGFDVPFSLVGTYTFTNNYNATYSAKVYRTNLINGDINFDITY